MRSSMTRRDDNRRRGRRYLGMGGNREGSVAVELAFVVPVIAVIVAGIADFGTLATRTDALAGATRIGGEYAKQGLACQSGIQVLSSPPMDTACRDAIQTAMTGSMTFSPAL